jgi:hypothetical protein
MLAIALLLVTSLSLPLIFAYLSLAGTIPSPMVLLSPMQIIAVIPMTFFTGFVV